MEQKKQKSGHAITSFVLGLVSFIPLLGVLLGLLAVIFGVVGLNKIKKHSLEGKKLALAGIILGILGIVFTFSVYGSLYYYGFVSKTGPFVDLKVRASKQILTQDVGALELYKDKNGQYSETLEEVKDAGFTVFTSDHYMKPFYYKVSEDKQSYELRSLGPDGEYGTEDDILPGE